MRRQPHLEEGFTLVELMIALAIIAILAAVAIPEFLDMQLRSRRTEAWLNVKGIAVAELAYYELYDSLVDCDTSPSTPLDRTAHPFDESAVGWLDLGWVPDGLVRCHYGTQIFTNSNGQWVRVTSTCDMDNDNLIATWLMDVDPETTSGSAQHMVLRPNSATAAQVRY